MKITIGITGASGSVYGYALVRLLNSLGVETQVILTVMGERVLEYECGVTREMLERFTSVEENDNLFSLLASGSCQTDGMVVVPCSMNTLGSIANGMGDTLLNRCASVHLKEGRKLVLVIRETPLSIIHMENMLKAARAGACIMPASPGFYQRPEQIWQLVDAVLHRVLDRLGIVCENKERWKGQ